MTELEPLVDPCKGCHIPEDRRTNIKCATCSLYGSKRAYQARKAEREALYDWGKEKCTEHHGYRIIYRRICDQCWQSLLEAGVEKGEK